MRAERGLWAYDPAHLTITHGPSGIEVDVGVGGSSTLRVKTAAGHWDAHPIERYIIAEAFNMIAKEETRRAVEKHMEASASSRRPMLTHEAAPTLPDRKPAALTGDRTAQPGSGSPAPMPCATFASGPVQPEKLTLDMEAFRREVEDR